MSNQETFGTRFRKCRKAKNLTQQKIASIFYLNTSSISKYEQGISTPETSLLIQFADFFDVSIDYLLCQTDIPTKLPQKATMVLMDEINQAYVLTKKEREALTTYQSLTENSRQEILDFIAFKGMRR